MSNQQGVIMFAHNNEKINYFDIAFINARMIQIHLGVPITLITDDLTHNAARKKYSESELNIFHNIILDNDQYENNNRIYSDTVAHREKLNFRNRNRHLAYKLSPYEETLLLDCDYLIQSDALSKCWGSHNEIMINRDIQEVHRLHADSGKYIGDFSACMYWATVVYFKKGYEAGTFFSKVNEVAKNYNYFNALYNFPSSMYRNDWAFSIAAHEMSGHTGAALPSLPDPIILKSFDKDDIAEVKRDNLLLLLQKPTQTDKFILTRVEGCDIHIMNKFSILRHRDKFLEIYK